MPFPQPKAPKPAFHCQPLGSVLTTGRHTSREAEVFLPFLREQLFQKNSAMLLEVISNRDRSRRLNCVVTA